MYKPYGFKEEDFAVVEQEGFLVHYAVSEFDFPGSFQDMHTHFLPENFNHPDLQLVHIPGYAGIEYYYHLMLKIVDRIKDGDSFKAGQVDWSLFKQDVPVQFVAATESDREVLRVLIGDSNGFLPTDPNCHPNFKLQVEYTEPEE